MGRTAACRKPAAPTTVAERRRKLRAKEGPALARAEKRVEIDLSRPEARKALTALYPRPEDDTVLRATPELEAVALRYVEARDAATLAEERKAAAGNELCNAIAKHLGVEGEGWKATWDLVKGSVDWTAVAKEVGIPDDVIAKHRKPSARTLVVRETAEEEA